MLLAVDIGNSNIVLGAYDGRTQLHHARLTTDPLKTEYEYAVMLGNILSLWGVERSDFDCTAISSVVPAITGVFPRAIELLLGHRPLVVGPGIKTGLDIRIDEPASTGADLVCTAVGALECYPLPCIIVDLGTATKITVVDKNRCFIGGSIAPGVMVSLRALSSSAAQLPHIGIHSDIKLIGANTVDCMLSGAILGAAAMLDGMIERYREALGPSTAVATGGLSEIIVPHCRTELICDPTLLLDGLTSIYYRNRG